MLGERRFQVCIAAVRAYLPKKFWQQKNATCPFDPEQPFSALRTYGK
jgi:hypothetical protein